MPLLHVVRGEDPEVLALWAAALNAESYEVAVTASEHELVGTLPERIRRRARRTARLRGHDSPL